MAGGKRENDPGVMEVTAGGKLLLGDDGGELLVGLLCSFLSTAGLELNNDSIQKEVFSL